MRSSAPVLFLMAASAASCRHPSVVSIEVTPDTHATPSASAAASSAAASSAPVASTSGAAPAVSFDAQLGATTTVPLAPGRYAAAIERSKSEYPSTELHILEWAKGIATLDLGAGGDADACFASRSGSSTTGSYHYDVTKRGTTTRSQQRTLVGARGRWRREADGWTDLLFDRTTRDRCPEDADAGVSTGVSIHLRCVGVAANATLASSLLACTSAEADHSDAWPVRDLMLEVATPPASRWLLLAPLPGASIRRIIERGGPAKITVAPQAVVLSLAAWTKD